MSYFVSYFVRSTTYFMLYGTCTRTSAESGTLVSTHALEQATDQPECRVPPKLRTLEIVLPVDSAWVRVPGADVPTRDVVQRKSQKKNTLNQGPAAWICFLTPGTHNNCIKAPIPFTMCILYIEWFYCWQRYTSRHRWLVRLATTVLYRSGQYN
jgi:hypothetical protein